MPITIKNITFIQFQKLYYDYLIENYTYVYSHACNDIGLEN